MKPYYQNSNSVIYCGDNAKVLCSLESESVDLVVASPPYDGLRDYKGYCFDFEALAPQLIRVLRARVFPCAREENGAGCEACLYEWAKANKE